MITNSFAYFFGAGSEVEFSLGTPAHFLPILLMLPLCIWQHEATLPWAQLGTIACVSLWLKPGEPYNLHKSEVWLKKQYGQLIVTLSEVQDPGQLIKDCRAMFPVDSLSKKYKQVLADFRRSQPEAPPTIRYYNGGVAINGEFYPYEQQEMDDLLT